MCGIEMESWYVYVLGVGMGMGEGGGGGGGGEMLDAFTELWIYLSFSLPDLASFLTL